MKKTSLTLKGIPAAPGIVIGEARLIDSEEISIPKKRAIKDEQLNNEISRFKDALIRTKNEILEIKTFYEEQFLEEHLKIHYLAFRLPDRQIIELPDESG